MSDTLRFRGVGNQNQTYNQGIWSMLESQLKGRIRPPKSVNNHLEGRGLVVFPGALGDFLCFLPTLKVIWELKQGSHLEVVMRSDFSDLLSCSCPTISVRSLDNHKIGRLFVPRAELDSELRNSLSRYDFIYSWFGAHDPDFVGNLTALCDGEFRIFPFRPSDPGIHLMDYYGSCLDVRHSPQYFPEISLTTRGLAWSQRYWSKTKLHGQRVLAVAPGSGAKEKNWRLSFFMEIGRWWRDRTGGRMLVILGPAEEGSKVEAMAGEDVLVVRHLGLGQVAALLSQCDLYLGNDSGITHLAAAIGIGTVALFGPTDPVQWRPRGNCVTVITEGVECSPCGMSTMRSCAHRKCLSCLSPETVIGILEGMVAESLLDMDGLRI